MFESYKCYYNNFIPYVYFVFKWENQHHFLLHFGFPITYRETRELQMSESRIKVGFGFEEKNLQRKNEWR